MDEPTVTISLEQYNQLRDNAVLNQVLFNKIVGYEIQINDFQRRLFEIEMKVSKS